MNSVEQIADNIIAVHSESDISCAVRSVRYRAQQLNFKAITVYYLATVASELATNLYFHAGGGEFEILTLQNGLGIALITRDNGPGIQDINQALEEGFSTAGGLGCGLPGIKRLMDNLSIVSVPGVETIVRAEKWR